MQLDGKSTKVLKCGAVVAGTPLLVEIPAGTRPYVVIYVDMAGAAGSYDVDILVKAKATSGDAFAAVQNKQLEAAVFQQVAEGVDPYASSNYITDPTGKITVPFVSNCAIELKLPFDTTTRQYSSQLSLDFSANAGVAVVVTTPDF